jgi:hypothetical protein
MRGRIGAVALTILLTAVWPAGTVAQEAAVPGLTTVRYYQCGVGDLDEAISILNGTWRETADELVGEGVLLGYGILTHAWGDEWNLVDYIVAANMEAFQVGWAELLRRYQARDRDGSDIDDLNELCPRHKDNIYSVVPPR